MTRVFSYPSNIAARSKANDGVNRRKRSRASAVDEGNESKTASISTDFAGKRRRLDSVIPQSKAVVDEKMT